MDEHHPKQSKLTLFVQKTSYFSISKILIRWTRRYIIVLLKAVSKVQCFEFFKIFVTQEIFISHNYKSTIFDVWDYLNSDRWYHWLLILKIISSSEQKLCCWKLLISFGSEGINFLNKMLSCDFRYFHFYAYLLHDSNL